MTLTLSITNHDRLDNGMPTEFVLHRRGALIGRSPTCDWSLPDGRNFISSRHAEVSFGDGFYTLNDISMNGTILNGAPDRMSAPRRIENGDVFTFGHYEIRATLSGEAAAAVERQQDAVAAAAQANAWRGWGGEAAPAAPADTGWRAAPSGAWGGAPAASGNDGWGSAPPPPAQGGNVVPPISGGEGWSLSARAPDIEVRSAWGAPAASPQEPASAWSSAVPDRPPPPSTDDIWGKLADNNVVDWARGGFGAPAASAADPLGLAKPAGRDALGGGAQAQGGWGAPAPAPVPAPSQPAAGWGAAEPSAGGWGAEPTPAPTPSASAWGAPPPPAAAPASAGWGAPEPTPPAPSGWAAPPAEPPPPAQQPAWGAAPGEQPAPPPRMTPAAPSPEPAPTPAPSPAAAGADPTALAHAFIAALGTPSGAIKDLSPSTMERAGQLFRRLVAGLVVMVEARARAKSQLGAEATAFEFEGNNPIKFARSPEEAIATLLNPQQRGFMTAERAVEDAYFDLQSHQMATLKAMQGALRATLDRFSPTAIRQRAEGAGVMARILPGARDAALWQAYEKEFGGVAMGSDEAFMDVFSKEFRRAYEEQAAQQRARRRS